MKVVSAVLLAALMLLAVACTGGAAEPTAATMDSEPTPDVQSTVEAGIAATKGADLAIKATITARVAATQAAETTPEPTPTLQPSPTVAPTATPIPSPTPTLQPSPTIAPTATPIPSPSPTAAPTRAPVPKPTAIPATGGRRLSGNWHSDPDWERYINEMMKETEPTANFEIRGATLYPTPESTDKELGLSLACFGPDQVAYLSPLSGVVPEYVDQYLFGIWDNNNEEFLESPWYSSSSPTLTSTGTDIYISSDAELRQILEMLTYAADGLEPGQTLAAGMGKSGNEFRGLWSDFDAAGIDDALQYLGCFPDVSAARGTSPPASADLKAYADRHAGGPGAIYVGDLSQLVGPAVADDVMSAYGADLGDDDGIVPLSALNQHRWIYESEYYRSLLDKARLTNPTQLASRGERITLRHTCINRTLLWCKHLEAYFIPNVEARTNGQVRIELTSFPELGIAGPDTAIMLANGTLGMAEIYAGYVGGKFPVLDIQYSWGLWPDHQTHFEVQANIADDLDHIVSEQMGSQVLMRNWFVGDDQYVFSDQRLVSPRDFRDLKTRSHSQQLSDWLDGMGAQPQFIAFADVYTALERNILDAAVTGANPGLGQRWYEVVHYLNGPLFVFDSTMNAINKDVWNAIPRDLQLILIEEGAKHELEALRLAAIQSLTGLQRNIEAGLVYVEFNSEIRRRGFEAAYENVLPNWLRRLGYPGYDDGTVAVFNEHVGPMVGLRIERDGTVVKVPITQGPHAGKTMEQVLAE